MKEFVVLQRIDNDRPITKDDGFFLFCQQALLLALRDCGTLTESQYQRAAEKLRTQFRGNREERQ